MIIQTMVVLVALAALCAIASAQPIDIGSRLELMVDDYLIEEMTGAELVLRIRVTKGAGRDYDPSDHLPGWRHCHDAP